MQTDFGTWENEETTLPDVNNSDVYKQCFDVSKRQTNETKRFSLLLA